MRHLVSAYRVRAPGAVDKICYDVYRLALFLGSEVTPLCAYSTVGGVPVTPGYVGIPTWSVGVLQINFTVPATLAAGTQQVVVTIGGVSSPAAALSVTPP
jgi:hypothetical protein